MQALPLPDGVVLLQAVVPPEHQEEVVRILLEGSTVDLDDELDGSKYHDNPFLAFCQLFALRWKRKEEANDPIPSFVDALSQEVHDRLYGEGGIYPKEENGCSEDHLGRPCSCADRTPMLPRSTVLNCVETLAYRANTQRGYHRDAHWMVGLSFGCSVRMGFRRHDDQDSTEVTIPSGGAVLFNGALHQHAVLDIVEGTAPLWWSYPFARVVFLMRDARQSFQAHKRRQKRREAALQGGKEAAAVAAERMAAKEADQEERDQTKSNYDIII
eukprot:TRINITY_DN8094_c0_g1_i3.p1 TRINITY_DN8094_c0_g1~~TRINITY_DN8094_c0_g1_i3.p1  ORF type:complete len:271 (-),score=46.95 TRINITY_DN8094_c0_g1_i3:95-907(-)